MRVIAPVVSCVAFAVFASFTRAQPSFQGLGDLPGGWFVSVPNDVSADGSVVVGSSSIEGESTGQRAFRWTRETGMVQLSALPDANSDARGVSGEGRIIVGFWSQPDGSGWGFRWENGVVTKLGDLPGGVSSSNANAIAPDGQVIVGASVSSNGPEAYRWQGGTMTGLGALPSPHFSSDANSVSGDGSVIVGHSDVANREEAFRWTASDGMEGLGDLPGGKVGSEALDVSADGKVIVGHSSSGSNREAFLWKDGVMLGLGGLYGAPFHSTAYGVSGDGSVVVGVDYTSPGTLPHAFVWDGVHGMRDLQSVLETDFGLDLGGWTLRTAYAVSDDGKTIVGEGTNPDGNTEAWMAYLPTYPVPVIPAVSGSGAVWLGVLVMTTGTVVLARRCRDCS
jgi:probable HAF family extracellular repeat protein